MSDPTLYVYAVVPADSPAPSVTGIDGTSLEMVTARSGAAAIVHRHGGEPYEGSDDDVKRRVLEHSDVVEDCWTHASSVLPVSFNVIVRAAEETSATAEEQLRQWLTESGEELTEKLDKLAETSELRVEITLDPSQYARDHAEVAELRAESESKPPGVRRLLQKRLETLQRQLTDQAADELYPDYRSRIAACSLTLQEYSPRQRRADAVPVISAACLMPTPQISDLGHVLSAIQAENPDAQIRFLGPWPPYSFVDLQQPRG